MILLHFCCTFSYLDLKYFTLSMKMKPQHNLIHHTTKLLSSFFRVSTCVCIQVTLINNA